MFGTHFMPCTHQAAFEKRKGVFDGIGVNVALDVDFAAVIYRLMLGSWEVSPLHCEGIRCEIIGENHVYVLADVLSDEACNRLGLHIAGMEHAKLAIALTNTDND